MFCPNCTTPLTKNPKHAQQVFECTNCEGVFFILVTTKPIDTPKILTNTELAIFSDLSGDPNIPEDEL